MPCRLDLLHPRSINTPNTHSHSRQHSASHDTLVLFDICGSAGVAKQPTAQQRSFSSHILLGSSCSTFVIHAEGPLMRFDLQYQTRITRRRTDHCDVSWKAEMCLKCCILGTYLGVDFVVVGEIVFYARQHVDVHVLDGLTCSSSVLQADPDPHIRCDQVRGSIRTWQYAIAAWTLLCVDST